MNEADIIAKRLVPEYIRNLETYKAGKPIEELIRETGQTTVVKLASNENPFGPSLKAVKAIEEELSKLQFYPDIHSFHLKSTLCEKFNLKPTNVILGNGSEGIMSYIMRSFVAPETEVLTSEGTFIGFYVLARSVGAKIHTVPLTNDLKFDVKALVEAVTDKTQLLYIANPNNPTGTYLTTEEFEYIANNVPKTTLIIMDEAYFDFCKDVPDYPDSMRYRFDNVLTLRTFSKSYGLAGVRMGYGFGHEALINNLHKVKLPFEPNHLAQVAAVAALDDDEHLERTISNNTELLKQTYNVLKDLSLSPVPSVGNFVCFDAKEEDRAKMIYDKLLQKGVIIRPLTQNGLPTFLRVSIGTKEEMEVFFDEIKNVMNSINS
ncbi:MAG: histidinol-phosphate transaminase [Bacteriovoracaceae bacterium]